MGKGLLASSALARNDNLLIFFSFSQKQSNYDIFGAEPLKRHTAAKKNLATKCPSLSPHDNYTEKVTSFKKITGEIISFPPCQNTVYSSFSPHLYSPLCEHLLIPIWRIILDHAMSFFSNKKLPPSATQKSLICEIFKNFKTTPLHTILCGENDGDLQFSKIILLLILISTGKLFSVVDSCWLPWWLHLATFDCRWGARWRSLLAFTFICTRVYSLTNNTFRVFSSQ